MLEIVVTAWAIGLFMGVVICVIAMLSDPFNK